MNGHDFGGISRFLDPVGRSIWSSERFEYRLRPPLTRYATWWPEKSRVFVPGSLR